MSHQKGKSVQSRVNSLRSMVLEEQHEIERKIKKTLNSILAQRKSKPVKQELSDRVKSFRLFSKHILDQFFPMILDEETLSVTTQADIIENIERMKKSIFSIINKIQMNLEDQSGSIIEINHSIDTKNQIQNTRNSNQGNEEQMPSRRESQEPNSPESLNGLGEQRERSRDKQHHGKKGKNAKINSESIIELNLWLLKNFESPYPTLEEKSQMAKKSGLSLVQVNNWFINARERVVKKYHGKQPQLL